MDPTLNNVYQPEVEDAAYEPYLSALEAEHGISSQDQGQDLAQGQYGFNIPSSNASRTTGNTVLSRNPPDDVAAVNIAPVFSQASFTALQETGPFLDEQFLSTAANNQFAMDIPGSEVVCLNSATPLTSSHSGTHSYGTSPYAEDLNLDLGFGQDNSWATPAQPDLSKYTMAAAIIDDFFLKNGAYRPPLPCTQCQRQRLQCLILQTTEANPNPITSCSSCVALYRDCSLAERSKRQASSFETSLPVIGHLHGVAEEELHGHIESGQWHETSAIGPSTTTTQAATAISAENTRSLSNWLARHRDHPYPSEDDTIALAAESRLSRTQVVQWFTSARRRLRQRLSQNIVPIFHRQGSPMPTSIFDKHMSPMERWRNSPPKDDPISAAAIAGTTGGTSELPMPAAESPYLDSLGSSHDGSVSSKSGDSFMYPSRGRHAASPGSASGSSVHSHGSTNLPFNFSARGSVDGQSADGESPGPSSSRRKSTSFQCTFCWQSFHKRYDWARHERSIHLPGLDAWVCSVPLPKDQSFLIWQPESKHPDCIFCGHANPSNKHIQSHQFQPCAERPKAERTFPRKDHLWQHLHKFHRCKKWAGWRLDLNLLQSRQEKMISQCGFCQVTMSSWDERVKHLASHFRRGVSKEDWTDPGTIRLPDGTELPK